MYRKLLNMLKNMLKSQQMQATEKIARRMEKEKRAAKKAEKAARAERKRTSPKAQMREG